VPTRLGQRFHRGIGLTAQCRVADQIGVAYASCPKSALIVFAPLRITPICRPAAARIP
jgi:hypothetical protein